MIVNINKVISFNVWFTSNFKDYFTNETFVNDDICNMYCKLYYATFKKLVDFTKFATAKDMYHYLVNCGYISRL